MALTYGKEIAKMKIVCTDNDNKTVSQTFSNLKSTATPEDIYSIGFMMSSMTTLNFDHVSKISEAEIIL